MVKSKTTTKSVEYMPVPRDEPAPIHVEKHTRQQKQSGPGMLDRIIPRRKPKSQPKQFIDALEK